MKRIVDRQRFNAAAIVMAIIFLMILAIGTIQDRADRQIETLQSIETMKEGGQK